MIHMCAPPLSSFFFLSVFMPLTNWNILILFAFSTFPSSNSDRLFLVREQGSLTIIFVADNDSTQNIVIFLATPLSLSLLLCAYLFLRQPMVQTSSMQGWNSSEILGLYCVFSIWNLWNQWVWFSLGFMWLCCLGERRNERRWRKMKE